MRYLFRRKLEMDGFDPASPIFGGQTETGGETNGSSTKQQKYKFRVLVVVIIIVIVTVIVLCVMTA